MHKQERAYFFQVNLNSGTTDEIRDILHRHSRDSERPLVEAAYGTKEFRLDETCWHEREQAITGTIFEVRKDGFPSALDASQSAPIPLRKDQVLGEPMCFAYQPRFNASHGVIAVQYSHYGPKYSSIPALVEAVGWTKGFVLHPVLCKGAWERLADAKIIRWLEFRIAEPSDMKTLRAAGQSANAAIDILNDTEGLSVDVKVSIGHKKRGSLSIERIKELCAALFQSGQVATLRLSGRSEGDQTSTLIDLLENERFRIQFDVAHNSHREVDRRDCQNKLLALLVECHHQICA